LIGTVAIDLAFVEGDSMRNDSKTIADPVQGKKA